MRSALSLAALVAVVGVAVVLAGCGGGGSSGGSSNNLLQVRNADSPNGKFFPLVAQPATENQAFWIEFTAAVNPATIFDGSTTNGLSSALRILDYYYNGPNQTPATVLTRGRLRGYAVLDGQTNFNFSTKQFSAGASTSVSNAQLNISSTIPLTKETGSILVFVADADGDPATIETFLPPELRQNSNLLQNSQIMVNCTPSIQSVGGRALDPEFTTNFVIGGSDQIPPAVDQTSPPPGSSGIAVQSTIVIKLNEPIDASTVVVAGPGSAVPATAATVNLQVSAQVIPPGQPTPQLVNIDGAITPSSGQTSEITFTPQANFPGTTLVVVNIYSAANTLINPTPPPYHAAMTDPSANVLSPNGFTDATYTFTTGSGPQLANSPIEPEAIHFLTSSALGAVRTNLLDRTATGQEDVVQEVNQRGDLAHPFSGGLLDGVVGPFVSNLMGTGGNSINNPPRQCRSWLQNLVHRGNPPTLNVVAPGKYSPPGVSDRDTCTAVQIPASPPICPPPGVNYCPEVLNPPGCLNPGKPATPLGAYLFITNEVQNVVHCVNSHTYQILKDIPTPDPRGLGISPNMQFLYVANFGANSLSVLDVSAGQDGLPKGDLVRLIPVGSGPWNVAAQPGNEDILVTNRLGKTMSVITVRDLGNPQTPVRVTMQSNDPFDVHAGPRLGGFPYWAFVSNPGTNEISIFEAGPQQTNGFGRDQIINTIQNLDRPTGLNGDQWFNVWSPGPNPVPSTTSATGVFVAMNSNATVAHLKLTRLISSPFPNPPPGLIEARFEITAVVQVGESPRDVCVDNNILYCNTPDGKQWPYVTTTPPAPVTAPPSRLYVTNGDGTIGVYDIRTGRQFTRMNAAGARHVFGYYSQ